MHKIHPEVDFESSRSSESESSPSPLFVFPNATLFVVTCVMIRNQTNLRIKINPVPEQLCRFVKTPHCGISTFVNHFDYRLIVNKDTQHSRITRIHCIWNGMFVGMTLCVRMFVLHVWLDDC